MLCQDPLLQTQLISAQTQLPCLGHKLNCLLISQRKMKHVLGRIPACLYISWHITPWQLQAHQCLVPGREKDRGRIYDLEGQLLELGSTIVLDQNPVSISAITLTFTSTNVTGRMCALCTARSSGSISSVRSTRPSVSSAPSFTLLPSVSATIACSS